MIIGLIAGGVVIISGIAATGTVLVARALTNGGKRQ